MLVCLFVYLFEGGIVSERVHEQRGEAKGEGEAKSLSREPKAGLNPGPGDHRLSQRQTKMLNQLRHLGTSMLVLF